MSRLLIFVLSFLFVSASQGSSLVTWGKMTKLAGTPVPYLTAASSDDGYVFVTMRVSPADENQPCVTPTQTDHADNFFREGNLELILAAVPEGFQNVLAKEMPVATFQWSDKDGRYCATPFTLPVMVVPTTKFGNDGNTNWPNPRLNIFVNATASEQNKVIHLAQAMIGILGSVATGGAASTLVGLSKTISGDAAKTIADEYDKRQKFSLKQVIPLSFTWAELQGGLRRVEIPIVAGEDKFLEGTEDAMKRLHASSGEGKDIKTIFRVEVNFEYRRSVFSGDNDLNAAFYPTNVSLLNKDRVLNHPKNALGIPNILQKVNGDAPTLGTLIKVDNATRCGVAINILRDLGLTSLDRAIAMNAFLDEIAPTWRTNSEFQSRCFLLDKDVMPTLKTVFGAGAYGAAAIGFSNNDVTTDLPTWWRPVVTDRMSDLQAIFYQPPAARVARLSRIAGATPPSLFFDFINAVAGEEAKQFQALEVSSMGCIFGREDDANYQVGDGKAYRGYAVALAKADGDHKSSRYLVEAVFAAATPNNLLALQMRSMETPPYNSYAASIRAHSFKAESECRSKILN